MLIFELKTVLLGKESPNTTDASPNSFRSYAWNANLIEKYSFTMRREFERAKEEADLIEQLRNVSLLENVKYFFVPRSFI